MHELLSFVCNTEGGSGIVVCAHRRHAQVSILDGCRKSVTQLQSFYCGIPGDQVRAGVEKELQTLTFHPAQQADKLNKRYAELKESPESSKSDQK
jgi:hypothetical protein